MPGVGPKTAAKWISEYGSLDGVIEHVDEIKGKAGESLREHLADVIRNYADQRADLRPRAADRRSPSCSWRSWDRDAVHQVFDTLQFRVLRDRLYATSRRPSRRPSRASTSPARVLGAGRARRLARRARAAAARRSGVACRGAFGRGTGAADRHRDGRRAAVAGAWFDPTELDPADERRSRPGWPTRAGPKVLHDAKGPMLAFAARGWKLAGLTADTALAAYLVRPDQRTYDLADLVLR